MGTPFNTDLLNAIIDELQKRGPCRYNELWESLQNLTSKKTFTDYLQFLVKQEIVKRQARRALPGGRWITVTRGPNVRYFVAKTSPFSPDASKERIEEWIERNLIRSHRDLLLAIEYCLKSDAEWNRIYKQFEKTMRLNLKLWWDMRKKQKFPEAIVTLLHDVEKERRLLESKLIAQEKPGVSAASS
jgi:hypothetical protein